MPKPGLSFTLLTEANAQKFASIVCLLDPSFGKFQWKSLKQETLSVAHVY